MLLKFCNRAAVATAAAATSGTDTASATVAAATAHCPCSPLTQTLVLQSQLLTQLRKELRCSSAKWWHSAKERYQLELPEAVKVPQGFDLKTKKKGFRRFWSPFTQQKLKELAEAEAALVEGQRDQVSCNSSSTSNCMQYCASAGCCGVCSKLYAAWCCFEHLRYSVPRVTVEAVVGGAMLQCYMQAPHMRLTLLLSEVLVRPFLLPLLAKHYGNANKILSGACETTAAAACAPSCHSYC
jgi:MutS family domain IV